MHRLVHKLPVEKAAEFAWQEGHQSRSWRKIRAFSSPKKIYKIVFRQVAKKTFVVYYYHVNK